MLYIQVYSYYYQAQHCELSTNKPLADNKRVESHNPPIIKFPLRSQPSCRLQAYLWLCPPSSGQPLSLLAGFSQGLTGHPSAEPWHPWPAQEPSYVGSSFSLRPWSYAWQLFQSLILDGRIEVQTVYRLKWLFKSRVVTPLCVVLFKQESLTSS